jgi:hypothetical protein
MNYGQKSELYNKAADLKTILSDKSLQSNCKDVSGNICKINIGIRDFSSITKLDRHESYTQSAKTRPQIKIEHLFYGVGWL